jgi:hypothetical protein
MDFFKKSGNSIRRTLKAFYIQRYDSALISTRDGELLVFGILARKNVGFWQARLMRLTQAVIAAFKRRLTSAR